MARAKRLAAHKRKRKQMESCLTLCRSFYGAEDQVVQSFVEEHPTADKSRLLSKILAQMMIRCEQSVEDAQMEELLKYKYTPLTFDYKQASY